VHDGASGGVAHDGELGRRIVRGADPSASGVQVGAGARDGLPRGRLHGTVTRQPIRRVARSWHGLMNLPLVALVARRTTMGLDVYAQRGPEEDLTEDDERAFEAAEISLCGGILSGAAGSFRGKVYARLVDAITGENLYQEWIPPERVTRMCEALHRCAPDEFDDAHDHRFGDVETAVANLRKFMKVCADRGLGLVGSW